MSPWSAPARRSLPALAALVALTALACAPAPLASSSTGPAGALDETCPIEPERFGVFDEGDVPLVITSTHAGATVPLGCSADDDVLRPIEERACDASLDTCASGPCRTGSGDRGARLITFALVEELERCIGRPHLALTEVSRTLVDMNRDAYDEVGQRCAMEDEAALPYWEAYHRGVDELVEKALAQAAQREDARALLVDIHTYATLPAAPPPAVMIGAGNPFGATLPVLTADDPTLARVFAANVGLRDRLRSAFAALDAGVVVHPAAADASLEGLFAGRHVVHHHSQGHGAHAPIDALQIEVSSGLRDDELGAAHAIATAICGAFGPRLRGGAL